LRGREQQVDVIAHEDISVNRAIQARGVIAQRFEEGQPVLLAKKAWRVSAAAADHVQHNARGMGNE